MCPVSLAPGRLIGAPAALGIGLDIGDRVGYGGQHRFGDGDINDPNSFDSHTQCGTDFSIQLIAYSLA